MASYSIVTEDNNIPDIKKEVIYVGKYSKPNWENRNF